MPASKPRGRRRDGGEIVGNVGARSMYIHPRIVELGPENPLLRFVTFMGTYALQVRDHPDLGPYSDERSGRFARIVLMDDEELRVVDANGFDDEVIAGHFGVPIEQVAQKRDDLAR